MSPPTAGENVTTAIRADLKEFKAETDTRFTEVRADLKEFKAEINARVDGVAVAIQALHRENATIRWMIGGGFALLGLFIAISTLFLSSSGS